MHHFDSLSFGTHAKKIKSLKKRVEGWVKQQLTSRPTPSNSKTYLDTNGYMNF
jgi:hypothetical protein